MEFSAETYGKWILAGEHAVLRGSPALVLPVKKFGMQFHWAESDAPLVVEFVGEKGDELKLIFWGLIEHALQKVGHLRSELTGRLLIESSLPLGAGLGASAALCVGVARLFCFMGWIQQPDIYEFSRQMEGLFHGESSGVDIAVALDGYGLRFQRGGERTQLLQNWSPQFYLSYSGERGVTSECVKRVRNLAEKYPELSVKIDDQMREAVALAEKSLSQTSSETGFDILVQAIEMARDCFYQWGLCEGALDLHMKMLTEAGAVAVKPTGSGGGGFVLSLWSEPPPAALLPNLIHL